MIPGNQRKVLDWGDASVLKARFYMEMGFGPLDLSRKPYILSAFSKNYSVILALLVFESKSKLKSRPPKWQLLLLRCCMHRSMSHHKLGTDYQLS